MNFIDLFAGAGFIRRGMEKAGHKCAGYVEWDKFARKSYEACHDTEGEWTENDITTVSDDDIRSLRDRNIGIITGGFPCQAFSIAGHRKGFDDARGTLFFEIARFASILRPKYLLLENVDGLRSHDGGRTLLKILNILGRLDYDVQAQVLNSKNFGVPQNRERIFFVCFNRDFGTESRPQVFPIGGSNEKTLKQIVGGSQGERVYNPEGGLSVTLSSDGGGQGAKTGLYLVNQPESGGFELSQQCQTLKARDYKDPIKVIQKTHGCNTTVHYDETGTFQAARLDKIPCVEVRPCLTPDREEKRQNGRRFKGPGEPMFTLTAQDIHGVYINQSDNFIRPPLKGLSRTIKANQHDAGIIDNDFCIRKLTPRECWRLQGSSDEVFDKAQAVNSDSQLYKQAGNGATETVVYEIAKRLI